MSSSNHNELQPESTPPFERYDRDFFVRLRRHALSIEQNMLEKLLSDLSKKTGKDILLYAAPYIIGSGKVAGNEVQVNGRDLPSLAAAMKGMGTRDLIFIVHSRGGDPNDAAQFMEYIHKKYTGKNITAVVPHKAMSAATMMCMGCHKILMSKFASLGPIDPQIDGVPAGAILGELTQALEDVGKNPSAANIWAPRIMQQPTGFYQFCKDAISYSKERVTEWLENYMFKGDQDAKCKAEQIAIWLSDGTNHKFHARPLTIDILKDKGIKVSEIEEDNDLAPNEFQNLVLGIFHALRAIFEKEPISKIIINQDAIGEIR